MTPAVAAAPVFQTHARNYWLFHGTVFALNKGMKRVFLGLTLSLFIGFSKLAFGQCDFDQVTAATRLTTTTLERMSEETSTLIENEAALQKAIAKFYKVQKIYPALKEVLKEMRPELLKAGNSTRDLDRLGSKGGPKVQKKLKGNFAALDRAATEIAKSIVSDANVKQSIRCKSLRLAGLNFISPAKADVSFTCSLSSDPNQEHFTIRASMRVDGNLDINIRFPDQNKKTFAKFGTHAHDEPVQVSDVYTTWYTYRFNGPKKTFEFLRGFHFLDRTFQTRGWNPSNAVYAPVEVSRLRLNQSIEKNDYEFFRSGRISKPLFSQIIKVTSSHVRALEDAGYFGNCHRSVAQTPPQPKPVPQPLRKSRLDETVELLLGEDWNHSGQNAK